jgi:hypothetical protein
MSANVIKLTNGIAARYAKLMTLGVRADQREQAIEEYMEFANRLVEAGFSHEDLARMKEKRREGLIQELREIAKV